MDGEDPESLRQLVYRISPPSRLLQAAIWLLRGAAIVAIVVAMLGLFNTKTGRELGGTGAVLGLLGQSFLFLVLAQLIVTQLELRRLLRELHGKVDDMRVRSP